MFSISIMMSSAADRLVVLVLLSLFCIGSAAQQDVLVDINASSVNQFISVSAPSMGPQFIPGYEYLTNITARWAVPDSAIVGITSDKVTLFVRASIVGNFSSFYFKDNGIRANITYFTLDCVVAGSACAEESDSEHAISLFTKTPASGTANDSARLLFEVSLLPFDEFTPIYIEAIDLGKQLDEMRGKLVSLNLSIENISQINGSLDEVQVVLGDYHIEEAKAKLNALKPTLGITEDPLKNLSFALAYLGAGLIALTLDLPYFIAFLFGATLFFSALVLKIRLAGKAFVCSMSLLTVAFAFIKGVDAPLLILIEIVMAALLLSIVFMWKGKTSRSRAGYRNEDN